MNMRFEDLVDRIDDQILVEKYYRYSFPEKKSQQLYDFYVLDYLKYLVDNMPPKNFRDLPSDLEDSVQDAVKTLFPALREELLSAVFYAVCAEMRHAETYKQNRQLFEQENNSRVIYNAYLKYFLFHNKSASDQDELVNIHNVRKPKTDKRIPESEKDNDRTRNLSYKAANYAIKKTGTSRKDFIKMAQEMYENGSWNSSYGGRAWARICAGWLMLHDAESLTPRGKKSDHQAKPMSVAIDHVYDLQHNTDTVFNKLKSYYESEKNKSYVWIKKALDHKASAKSYHELLKNCSGGVKSMALPILYNRLGQTWEDEIKKNDPSSLYQKSNDSNTQTTPSSNKSGNFKIGDKVIYKSGPYITLTKGSEYTVLDVDTDAKELFIKNDMGVNGQYEMYAFEKVSPEKSPNRNRPPKFKVGDMVTCIETLDKDSKFLTVGKTYKVISHVSLWDGFYIKITDDKGYDDYYDATQFTLTKSAKKDRSSQGETMRKAKDTTLKKSKFEVGDWVTHISDPDKYYIVVDVDNTKKIKVTDETGKFYDGYYPMDVFELDVKI